jgi:rhamnosyltransferase
VIHSHNYNCTQQFKRNFDLAVSQADHPEVFGGIRSESEGIRLVKQTAHYLSEQHKPWLIPGMFVKSGFKYMGYRMGKAYHMLPQWLVMKCTMNREYWLEKKEGGDRR